MLFGKKQKAKSRKTKAESLKPGCKITSDFRFRLSALSSKMAIIRQAIETVVGNYNMVGYFYIK